MIHHHVMPLARISLTLSRHFSLSFIASGRSSGLHPVSSNSCCMYDKWYNQTKLLRKLRKSYNFWGFSFQLAKPTLLLSSKLVSFDKLTPLTQMLLQSKQVKQTMHLRRIPHYITTSSARVSSNFQELLGVGRQKICHDGSKL